jgi:hypothetical protein
MTSLSNGAQWASRRVITTLIVHTLAVLLAFATILIVARPSPISAATDTILMSRSELLSRPTSGAAWTALKARADASIGTPDISNQDESADVTALAKGLVYARIGGAGYRADVIAALKRAVGTEAGGRTLALGRNLPGYVIAADMVDLPAADPSFDQNTFRPWLRSLLTKTLDGRTLVSTHEDRPNNWGTHAGAARAAIAGYLADGAQLARTALVFRGYLGDRAAYTGFEFGELSWQCDPLRPVGINPPCSRAGINLDGVLPDDLRRGGALQWPPASTGYPWEGMQGAVLQAELLRVQGYDAWSWSNRALLRATKFLYERAGWPATGDDEWQAWLIDKRYGTSYRDPAPARSGKNFGFTDWLYGPAGATSGGAPVPATPPPTPAPTRSATPTPTVRPTQTPGPTPAPTAAPTPAPTPGQTAAPTPGPTPTSTGDIAGEPTQTATTAPTAQPTTAPDPTPTTGNTPAPTAAPTEAPRPEPTAAPTPKPNESQSKVKPKVSRPTVKLSATSSVPTSGVPVVVDWALTDTQAGLARYELQGRVDGGDWQELGLASATGSASRRTVRSGATIRFRVRAIDQTGAVGAWATSETFRATALSDSSSAIRWSGKWAFASHSGFLGRRVHWAKARDRVATLTFEGTSVAWAAPVGPTRGKARVLVDGRAVATVDLGRATFRARDMVFARNLPEGRHTLRIQVLGTRGRPTVAIDGLYVLTPQ